MTTLKIIIANNSTHTLNAQQSTGMTAPMGLQVGYVKVGMFEYSYANSGGVSGTLSLLSSDGGYGLKLSWDNSDPRWKVTVEAHNLFIFTAGAPKTNATFFSLGDSQGNRWYVVEVCNTY